MALLVYYLILGLVFCLCQLWESDRGRGCGQDQCAKDTGKWGYNMQSIGCSRSYIVDLFYLLLDANCSQLVRSFSTVDTSTREGFRYILTETALALLRHPDCCISAYSSVDVMRSVEEGEARFNKLSIEERGKVDEETLVNVNNIEYERASSQRSENVSNEYIVITILVAAKEVHNLPVISGSTELKEALQKLCSIPSYKTLAVEVLWTPQDENDTLSEREFIENYPLLRSL